ncbi:hypothetical protein MM5_145 [Morganella phage vB_Mm5]
MHFETRKMAREFAKKHGIQQKHIKRGYIGWYISDVIVDTIKLKAKPVDKSVILGYVPKSDNELTQYIHTEIKQPLRKINHISGFIIGSAYKFDVDKIREYANKGIINKVVLNRLASSGYVITISHEHSNPETELVIGYCKSKSGVITSHALNANDLQYFIKLPDSLFSQAMFEHGVNVAPVTKPNGTVFGVNGGSMSGILKIKCNTVFDSGGKTKHNGIFKIADSTKLRNILTAYGFQNKVVILSGSSIMGHDSIIIVDNEILTLSGFVNISHIISANLHFFNDNVEYVETVTSDKMAKMLCVVVTQLHTAFKSSLNDVCKLSNNFTSGLEKINDTFNNFSWSIKQ